jgi:hypothetical protein
VTNSANAGVITAVFPATATTYAVGDRGPGGGIVFYVSAANFTSAGSTCGTACKYLEVAPATWQDTTAPINTTVANDLTYRFSDSTAATGQFADISSPAEGSFYLERENYKIGRGFNNTSLMRVPGATSEAQAAVLAYAGNSTAGQWFVPSANELNELCKYARGQTTGGVTVLCVTGTGSTGTLKTGTANDLGGFVADGYLSSSADGGARYQNFSSGAVGATTVLYAGRYVRPVRAF